MSCFNEGTNHTGGSRGVPGGAETGKGGRRSRLKASRRAQQQASEDPKKGRLGAEAAGQKSPSARNVKRLRSLERIFKGQPNDSNSMETTALPMKIGRITTTSQKLRLYTTKPPKMNPIEFA